MPQEPQLKSLDLFSGIGGLTHAFRGVAEPVAYCDIEPNSRSALESLFNRRLLPRAPIAQEVKSLDKACLDKHSTLKVDVIMGGFPCVGFSTAGVGRGLGDKRSAL